MRYGWGAPAPPPAQRTQYSDVDGSVQRGCRAQRLAPGGVGVPATGDQEQQQGHVRQVGEAGQGSARRQPAARHVALQHEAEVQGAHAQPQGVGCCCPVVVVPARVPGSVCGWPMGRGRRRSRCRTASGGGGGGPAAFHKRGPRAPGQDRPLTTARPASCGPPPRPGARVDAARGPTAVQPPPHPPAPAPLPRKSA